MYKVGDVVIHYRDGLSEIIGTTIMNDTEFFLLRAKRGGDVKIYVPLLKATQIIRPVMDKENADGLLKYMSSITETFIANTKQRRDDIKRRLASGNIYDIAVLCHFYYLAFVLNQIPENVKLGQMDYEMLTNAKNILYDELCVTYGIALEEIEKFVENRLSQI